MPFRNQKCPLNRKKATKRVYLFSSTIDSEKNLFIRKITKTIVTFHCISYLLGPLSLNPHKNNPTQ